MKIMLIIHIQHQINYLNNLTQKKRTKHLKHQHSINNNITDKNIKDRKGYILSNIIHSFFCCGGLVAPSLSISFNSSSFNKSFICR